LFAADNEPAGKGLCFLGAQLQEAVVEAKGWQLVGGAYEASEPGSSLVLQLDATLGKAAKGTRTPLLFTYASDKQGMGQVALR
jgi:hypothetical protein